MNKQTSGVLMAPDAVRNIIDTLFLRFGVSGLEEKNPQQAFLHCDKDDAAAMITRLKSLDGYTHLAFLTAVDQIERGKFALIYMLTNHALNHDLGVIVEIDRENAEMESIHHLWPAIDTYQRELREMYGIIFPGSPRLYEDFALEGWQDLPPMRRDFDSKEYSEKTYYARPGRQSTETRDQMKKKIYPSEAETW